MSRLTGFSRVGSIAILTAALLSSGVNSAVADSTFIAPNYPSPDCTPVVGGSTTLGLAPQQWNSSVGLPLTPTGTPLGQKIVIGEFDQTANVNAVNLVLAQCGLDPIVMGTHVNSGAAGAINAGLEATLDVAVAAAALPANASITLVNSPTGSGWYGLFVNIAEACGLEFDGDPWTGLRTLSTGSGFPAGGCIASVSYGQSEAGPGGTDENDADWVIDQLAANGVVVVVSAGDEGSGGCISASGTNFGDATTIALTGFEVTSQIATLTSSTNHGFTIGQNVFLGALSPKYDGMYRILSTPSLSTFTVAMIYPDQASTVVTSIASVNFGGLVPSYPATNPNVLAVGGTQWDSQSDSLSNGLNISYTAGAVVDNYVWRDSSPNSNCANLPNFPTTGGEGTGGGISSRYAMPEYQRAATSANYPSAPAMRMMPDLAALAGWPTYALANPGIAINGAELQSNVAKLYFEESHGVSVGELVSTTLLPAPFSALNVANSTVSAVTTNTVSFALTGVDLAPAYVDSGQLSQSCVAPCSASAFPWYPVVGTSAATPLTAIGIANVNAVLSARSLARITNNGNSMDIHSLVYSNSMSSAFTDVTNGNNDIQSLGNYSALTGFDMATGMGVPNFSVLASLLVAQLTPSDNGGGSQPSVTTPAQVGDPVVSEPANIDPAPLSPIVLPPVTTLGSGIRISVGPNVGNTQRVLIKKQLPQKLRKAPITYVKANRWRVPVVKVSLNSTPFAAQLRINGNWKSIGTFSSNERGRVTLSSIRIGKKRTVAFRLISSEEQTYFGKLSTRKKYSNP